VSEEVNRKLAVRSRLAQLSPLSQLLTYMPTLRATMQSVTVGLTDNVTLWRQ